MTVWGPGTPKYGREGRPKTRKRKKSAVKDVCDRTWSKIVKQRAGGVCERCGGNADNAHHFYGRKNHRLRFEPRNGIALCWSCHRFAHNEAPGFYEWFSEHRPGDNIWLRRENAKGTLQRSLSDYLALESELKAMLSP